MIESLQWLWVHTHSPDLRCFPGGASVLQAAALLRPADGSPLLPQLRARRRSGRSHQRFGGVPEGRQPPPPQRQPAGVTAMQPTAGTLSQTKSHRRCSCGWLEPVRRFVFEEISNKDEISSSCSPSSSDPAAHLLLLVVQSLAGRRMKCQDDWTCSCVTVAL